MNLNKKIKVPSNRSFGLLFFIIFLIISLWPIKSGEDLRLWSFILSLVFLILGITNSKLLTPLNKLWFEIGITLGNFISPVIMGVVFFLVVTPTGIIVRILGKDLLKTTKNKNISTYWINRVTKKTTMKKQF